MNFYQILGISKNASPEEVQRAYHGKAREHHPDATGSTDSSAFRTLHDAYETLSDPARRRAYDRSLGNEIPVARRTRKVPVGSRVRECRTRRGEGRVADEIIEVRSRRSSIL